MLIAGPEFNKTIPKRTESVIFTDTKAPDGATLTDVSEAQDGSIVAWLDGTTYKVSTQESGVKVFANPDLSYMFDGNENTACENLTNIDVTNLDTSQVTDMSYMFDSAGYSASIFTLDLSGWDTSQVTDMTYMFAYTGTKSSIFTIKGLSSWDTSKVTNMSYMFGLAGRNASTFTLDLSNWDTSKVTNMYCMFTFAGYEANAFNLDLSNWSIDKKADIEDIFYDAGYNATEWNIDCSSWALWNQIPNQRLSIH